MTDVDLLALDSSVYGLANTYVEQASKRFSKGRIVEGEDYLRRLTAAAARNVRYLDLTVLYVGHENYFLTSGFSCCPVSFSKAASSSFRKNF